MTRCAHTDHEDRCMEPATHRFRIGGTPAIPAVGVMCAEHAAEVCAEYAPLAATIGEWTAEPIDEATQ